MRLLGRSGNRSSAPSTPQSNNSVNSHSNSTQQGADDPQAAVTIAAALERPSASTSSRHRNTNEASFRTPTTLRSSNSLLRSSITGSTSIGSSGGRGRGKSSSKPVDLDAIYDGKLDLHLLADLDDSHNYNSDDSVGGATETSASKSSTTNDGTTPEDNRMSALVHTMAQKQQFISETFFEMIGSMTKMMLSMEEQMIAVTTTTAASSSVANRKNNETHMAKAQARAHRNVQKALEMQENALAMKTKQARIAQQFETLVHRLEQESLETSLHNQSLKRQLQMARVLLRDEAGVEMEDISDGAAAASYFSAGARTTPRSKSSSKRPPLSSGRRPGSVRSSPDGKTSLMMTMSSSSSMHPIREIAFSNTVVDVTEMSQAAAEAEDGSSNKNTNHDEDNDDDQRGLVVKESHSSDELTPHSQRTSTTAMTSTTETTVAENLRFLL